MKKILCFILLLYISQKAFSQGNENQLAEIALPSPTAFEMTKFGNVPVNESSGRISPTIPVYNYVAGNLSIPISLNYTGNGVKVDQLCSWTGINWNLNAGGAITRIVNDLPDDHVTSEKRIMYSQAFISESLKSENRVDFIYKLNDIAQNKTYDTQLDIFQFSIPGYSGSFYLDDQLNPVLTNYEFELKIMKKVMDQYGIKEFLIIDPQGVIYNFGENDATEQTMINPASPDKLSAITSFFLTSIVHPKGDIIYFQYDSEAPYFVRLSQSFHISKVYAHSQDACPAPSTNMNYTQPILNLSKILDGKYLNRIYSSRSDLSIDFNSRASNDGDEYKRVLNNISIYQKSVLVEKVELSYIRNEQRFFLNKVLFNGDKSQSGFGNPYEYSMDYNDPEGLPERLSYKQDHLGYFNNKNNQTLIPNISSYFQEINSYLANREPDFFYAIKGSLTNLHYPTGGYTHFEYEAPQVLYKEEFDSEKSLEIYCNYDGLVPDTRLTDGFSIGPELDEAGNVNSPPSQTIKVNVNVNSSERVNHHYIVYVKVLDVRELREEVRSFTLLYGTTSYKEEFEFDLLQDHLYSIKLEIEPDPESNMDPYFVYANAIIEYSKSASYKLGDGLGIRIKRISDYSGTTATPIIKRYYYKSASRLDDVSESTTSIATTGSYFYSSTYMSCCINSSENDPWPMPESTSYDLVHLQSNSLSSLFPTSDNAWLYNTVTISLGGDNFENGGIQKSFKIIEPSGPYSFFGNSSSPHEMERENQDMYNSKIENETYLIKGKEDSLFIIKSIDYNYNGMKYEPITNMIASRLYNICVGSGGVEGSILDNYHSTEGLYLGLYKTFSKTLYTDSIITTDFIDPVFVKSKHWFSNKKVVSKKAFRYGRAVGIPTEILNSSSNIDKVFKTKMYYPGQEIGLYGLSSEEINNYGALYRRHILSTAIQTEKYVGNFFTLPTLSDPDDANSSDSINNSVLIKKLSTNRVIYGADYLPKKIQFSTEENPLEDKAYYNQYDNMGNLLEVVKKDDISIVYIWGYKQTQPIAKIENASYSEVYNNSQLITALQALSDIDKDQTSEDDLRNLLNTLRGNFENAMVTTYTYDLPYGITSITDPRGISTYYVYDGFGRLSKELDHDKNIIKQYEYKYSR